MIADFGLRTADWHGNHSNEPAPGDFTVEDSEGAVEIESVSFADDEIVLALRRPIKDNAAVHYAYGVNPQTGIYEAVTNYPPLAFYNFKIER